MGVEGTVIFYLQDLDCVVPVLNDRARGRADQEMDETSDVGTRGGGSARHFSILSPSRRMTY